MSGEDQPDTQGESVSRDRWPIGFMLLVGATALYLGWRLVQGVAWVIESLTG